jgi:hypothetical protein
MEMVMALFAMNYSCRSVGVRNMFNLPSPTTGRSRGTAYRYSMYTRVEVLLAQRDVNDN